MTPLVKPEENGKGEKTRVGLSARQHAAPPASRTARVSDERVDAWTLEELQSLNEIGRHSIRVDHYLAT